MDKLTAEVLSTLVDNKYIASFFNKASCYFMLNESVHIKGLFQFRKKIFLLKQKNKIITKLTYVFLWNIQFLNIMIKRFILFNKNKDFQVIKPDVEKWLSLFEHHFVVFKWNLCPC